MPTDQPATAARRCWWCHGPHRVWPHHLIVMWRDDNPILAFTLLGVAALLIFVIAGVFGV